MADKTNIDNTAEESKHLDDPLEEEGLDAEGADSEDAELPRPDGTEWYVIHSYSGYENKVEKNLMHRIESMGMQDKIFQVVVPTEEEVELKDGHRRTIERRVFPGYILVEMVLDEDSWYVVRNTPGVTGFVGSGSKPTPLARMKSTKSSSEWKRKLPKLRLALKLARKSVLLKGRLKTFWAP